MRQFRMRGAELHSQWPAGIVMLGLACCIAGPAREAREPMHSMQPSESQDRSTASELAPAELPRRSAPEVQAPTLRPLDVPGFRSALLFTPRGTELRPLLVAAHGAGGSPEWECEYWRRLTRERAFVLCLRGTPLGSYDGFYYRDHVQLEREFLAAERAARALEPRIAPGAGVYAGFSQGATMGSAMIEKHGVRFPYLVLIEGFDAWNVPRAQKFARAGGKRVLFACGSKECRKIAKASLHWLELGGLEARFEDAPGAGHTPAGEVMTKVAGALSWLLRGDPLWLDVEALDGGSASL